MTGMRMTQMTTLIFSDATHTSQPAQREEEEEEETLGSQALVDADLPVGASLVRLATVHTPPT